MPILSRDAENRDCVESNVQGSAKRSADFVKQQPGRARQGQAEKSSKSRKKNHVQAF